MPAPLSHDDLLQMARAHGFADVGVTGVDIPEDEQYMLSWLEKGHHGEMDYMARHGLMRSRPALLHPGTLTVVSARMDYWPGEARDAWQVLGDHGLGYISRYALGRDYHKVLRAALAHLAEDLALRVAPHGYRVFTDSAPILEKAFARNAGLGWIGKHSLLISRRAGSWFFLGEILTDLPLAHDEPASAHCGTCTACIPACPTGAIIGPRQVDARRCISYLTIELKGAIPEQLRPLIGNRIYGCDDCQLVCPWNKFAKAAAHPDFKVRHDFDAPRLTELMGLTREQFEQRFEGSAVRRLSHARFLRNVAVALGNGPATAEAIHALEARRDDPDPLVAEHVQWALRRLTGTDAGCR
jgi:epoxyqueuosine reductase